MGKLLVIKIKEKGSSGIGCIEYRNEIPLEDFNQLALVLSDIEIYGGKIEKAFLEFKRQKEEVFPW